MSTSADKNKEQFNKQAYVFSQWSGTKNIDHMEFLRNFIGMSATDTLLDVACGSGDFTIFASRTVEAVTGIDISEQQIGIANRQSKKLGTNNTSFMCSNVEKLPFDNNAFSVVVSKSSFHHFRQHEQVMNEMFRCCKPGGQICIDDITSYEDAFASSIIDRMDKLMDVSHNRRLSIADFNQQFARLGLETLRTKTNEIVCSVAEYQQHALQSAENAKRLQQLVRATVADKKICKYMYEKGGEIYFINRGYTICGRKPT